MTNPGTRRGPCKCSADCRADDGDGGLAPFSRRRTLKTRVNSLLAVRIVCPFLDDLFGRPPPPAVVPLLRGGAVRPGLLLVNILIGSRGFLRFFRGSGTRGRLLVAPVIVPPAAKMAGAVPPVTPPLPGTTRALRGRWLLPGLLLRRLRRVLPGIPLLRVFFCHNCQTD